MSGKGRSGCPQDTMDRLGGTGSWHDKARSMEPLHRKGKSGTAKVRSPFMQHPEAEVKRGMSRVRAERRGGQGDSGEHRRRSRDDWTRKSYMEKRIGTRKRQAATHDWGRAT